MSIEELNESSVITHRELGQERSALPDIEVCTPEARLAGRLKRLGHSVLKLAGAGMLTAMP
ncbi:MAG: hypothetical protein ACREHG_09365, partial [Candidatus Saccharimonadales bacterium]